MSGRMPRVRGDDRMKGYAPLAWDAASDLSDDEQQCVEICRRDLWRNGVRTEPNLTRMAFEFGAVMAMTKATDDSGKGGE